MSVISERLSMGADAHRCQFDIYICNLMCKFISNVKITFSGKICIVTYASYVWITEPSTQKLIRGLNLTLIQTLLTSECTTSVRGVDITLVGLAINRVCVGLDTVVEVWRKYGEHSKHGLRCTRCCLKNSWSQIFKSVYFLVQLWNSTIDVVIW